jgi:hypothetical protein
MLGAIAQWGDDSYVQAVLSFMTSPAGPMGGGGSK